MYKIRRTIYLLLASASMLIPVFFAPLSFASDRGFMYVRSFFMTPTHVKTLETSISDDTVRMGAITSILPLTLTACAIALLILVTALLLHRRTLQNILCEVAIFACLTYPLVLIYYMISLADTLLTSCIFSWPALTPIIPISLLVLTRRNIHAERKRDTNRLLQEEVDAGIRMQFK